MHKIHVCIYVHMYICIYAFVSCVSPFSVCLHVTCTGNIHSCVHMHTYICAYAYFSNLSPFSGMFARYVYAFVYTYTHVYMY